MILEWNKGTFRDVDSAGDVTCWLRDEATGLVANKVYDDIGNRITFSDLATNKGNISAAYAQPEWSGLPNRKSGPKTSCASAVEMR